MGTQLATHPLTTLPSAGTKRMLKPAKIKKVLTTRIVDQMTRLTQLVSGNGQNENDTESASQGLAICPDLVDCIVGHIELLRPLDPLESLRQLRALDDLISGLDLGFEGCGSMLERRLALKRLIPSIQAELVNGRARDLPDRVLRLVVENKLLHDTENIPQILLSALGRDGRVTVARGLADLAHPPSLMSLVWRRRMTEILLAEPTTADALELVAQSGFKEKVSASLIVERLLEAEALGPEFLDWVLRTLSELGRDHDEHASLITRCIKRCEIEGRRGAAATIRREAKRAAGEAEIELKRKTMMETFLFQWLLE